MDSSRDENEKDDGMPHWWKWIALMATVYMAFIVNGYEYCFGLLKIQLLYEYPDRPASQIAIIGGLSPSLSLFLAPFGIACSEYFGPRFATIVGSSLSAICLFTAWLNGFLLKAGFILDVMVLGVGQGVAFAFLYGPSVAILPSYFGSHHLSLATGITNAGASAGIITYGFIANPLFGMYGWRGTMLFYSALSLQGVLAGLAFLKLSSPKHPYTATPSSESPVKNKLPSDKTMESLIPSASTTSQRHTFFTVLKKYFDTKLIFKVPFVLLLGSAALSIIGYFVPTVLVPKQMKIPEYNVSPFIQKNVMVFYGFCNLISRVFIGRIGDFALEYVVCTSYIVFIGGLVIVATACLVFPHFMYFGNIAFIAFVFVFAVASAPVITVRSLLAINLFGRSNANASFSWFLCAQGAVQIIGYVIPSWLDQSMGPVFSYLFAAVVFLGAATCCALTGKLFFSERRKEIEFLKIHGPNQQFLL